MPVWWWKSPIGLGHLKTKNDPSYDNKFRPIIFFEVLASKNVRHFCALIVCQFKFLQPKLTGAKNAILLNIDTIHSTRSRSSHEILISRLCLNYWSFAKVSLALKHTWAGQNNPKFLKSPNCTNSYRLWLVFIRKT